MPPVFSPAWFDRHQALLLTLLHLPLVGRAFRRFLGLRSGDVGRTGWIVRLEPHRVTVCTKWDRATGAATFIASHRTHPKFAKRLCYGLAPLWWAAHAWDMVVANPLHPAWNLGFDTLATVYPDASTGATTMDGYIQFAGTNGAWSVVRDTGTGTFATGTAAGAVAWIIEAGSTSWNRILRSWYHFDTSGLPAGATVTAATMSLYVTSKTDTMGLAGTSNIFASEIVANNTIATSDFQLIGETPFAADVAYAALTASAYSAFIFNASGLAAIVDGITKLACRESTYDAPNLTPSHNPSTINRLDVSHADQTGTSQDPKLDVTYTPSGVTLLPFITVLSARRVG